MSAVAAVRAGVRAAVTAHAALDAALNGIFETRPRQASVPWLELGEARESDWGGKAMTGREVRLTLVLRDEGPSGARLERLAGLMGEALGGLGRELGEWRVASAVVLGTRTARAKNGEWVATTELRVRMAKEI